MTEHTQNPPTAIRYPIDYAKFLVFATIDYVKFSVFATPSARLNVNRARSIFNTNLQGPRSIGAYYMGWYRLVESTRPARNHGSIARPIRADMHRKRSGHAAATPSCRNSLGSLNNLGFIKRIRVGHMRLTCNQNSRGAGLEKMTGCGSKLLYCINQHRSGSELY